MRVAMVTGGGRGIGRAVARALAGADSFVIVAGRNRDALESAALDLESLGGRSLAVEMDVTSEVSVHQAMREARDAIAHVDILVNNAGVGGGEPIVDSDTRRWRRTLDTNLVGMYLVSREVVPLMKAGGRIVNLSSVLGCFGVAG